MKRNALLIGGFVLVGLIIAIGSILWLSGNDLFTEQKKARVYYQGNASGLSVGAPVTFRGVTVGQVTDIGIQMDPATLKTTIPVSLKLQPSALHFTDDAAGKKLDIRELVQRGLRARLASQSIVTGQKAIDLDLLPNTPAILLGGPGVPEIPATPERFGPLIEQVAELPLRDSVADIRVAVQELRTTLVSVQHTLDGAQSALSGGTKELQLTAGESRKTLAAATEAIRVFQTNSTSAFQSMTKLADASRETVVKAQPELQRTLGQTQLAAESARLAMDRLADMAAPDAPLRADLESTVSDLSQAARSLRSLGQLLEERPNAIIFGKGRE
jgi:phospholipid/cholesterol/gamma-HCH transport system substrate-binding protein